MNDDQIFLANAYLDGELSPDERRAAEADPAVMTEVEQLRALQAELRRPVPASAAAREAAIGAAMAEFAARPPVSSAPAEPAGVPPGAAPLGGTVVPLRRRPWFAPALTVAAAAAGIGLAAVVVTQGGGDDDTLDVAEPIEEVFATEEPADEPASEPAFDEERAEAADDDGGTTALPPAGDDAVDMADDAATEEPAEEPADEPASEPTDGAVIDLTSVPGGSAANPAVDDDDLVAYARLVLDARDSGQLPATPESSCELPLTGPGGFLVVDDAVVRMLMSFALDDSSVVALAGDDAPNPCEVLAVVDLPPPDR